MQVPGASDFHKLFEEALSELSPEDREVVGRLSDRIAAGLAALAAKSPPVEAPAPVPRDAERLPPEMTELTGFGRLNGGAPAPVLLLGEHRAAISYYLDDTPEDWAGDTVHARNPSEDVAPMAVVEFDGVVETKSLPTSQPDHQHPLFPNLYENVVEVAGSEWAKSAGCEDRRHLIFTFHDTVIEILCASWQVHFVHSSSFGVMPRMRAYVFSR